MRQLPQVRSGRYKCSETPAGKKKKVGAKKNLAALIKLSSKTEESVIRFSLYQYIIQKFP